MAGEVGLDGEDRMLTRSGSERATRQALHEVVSQVALYAWTTPEHKLRIERALHAHGDRVVVIDDGINDSPALIAAEIR
jgi:P-type E1-E2 ATPase